MKPSSTASTLATSASTTRTAGSASPGSPVRGGSTVDFSQAARLLGREARRRGLIVPSYRCPPRIVGMQRTLRRHAGGVVIAVQLRGRPWGAVVADMIEGVVVANALQPPQSDRLRTELWQAVGLDWPAAVSCVA